MSFYFLFYFSLGSLKQDILLVPPEHAMHSTSTGLFHSNHWCKPFPPWRLIPQTTPMPAPQLSIFFPPLGFHSTLDTPLAQPYHRVLKQSIYSLSLTR